MAAGNVKGITILVGGDTVGLTKALSAVSKETNAIQRELKDVENKLKLDPKNVVMLAQKEELLGKAITENKTKLEALKNAEKQVSTDMKNGVEINQAQYRKLQREIVSTEQNLKGLETQGKKSNLAVSSVANDAAIGNVKKMGVAVAAVGVAVGAAFAGMTIKVLDNADELQKQADITGLSAERLQELSYAGQNLGVDIDTVTGAQAKLTKTMFAAQNGTKLQVDAFRKLDVKVLDGNGNLRDAKTVMEEAFTALGNMGNATERDALAMQIFGKSAMALNPLIKAGGDELNRLTEEARKNGAVMSDEAVKGIDDFGDKMEGLKTSVMGAFGESLAQLLPQLQEMISKIDMEKLKQDIKDFATNAVNALTFILNNGATITALISGIGAAFVTWNVATLIMGVVQSIKKFQLANEGATIAQWALNAAQKANPIGIIISLIVGLVAGIMVLWNTNEGFRTAVINAWEAVKNACIGLGAVIAKFFTVDIPNAFKSTMDFLQTNWKEIIFFIVNPIGGAIALLYNLNPQFKAWVDGLIASVKVWFGGMVQAGTDMVSGLWKGISNSWTWLTAKIKEWCGNIATAIKAFFGIHSPSTLMAEYGSYLVQGLAEGITNDMSAEQAMEKKASNLSKAFKDALSGLGIFSENINLKYENWLKGDGKDASETEKLDKELDNLNGTMDIQQDRVSAAKLAYDKMVETYGSQHEMSVQAENDMLKEIGTMQDLINKAQELNTTKKNQSVTSRDAYDEYLRDNGDSLRNQGISQTEINSAASRVTGYSPITTNPWVNTIKPLMSIPNISGSSTKNTSSTTNNMGVTQNFYTPTVTYSQMAQATKKGFNAWELGALL